jgi:hypothetical protein
VKQGRAVPLVVAGVLAVLGALVLLITYHADVEGGDAFLFDSQADPNRKGPPERALWLRPGS